MTDDTYLTIENPSKGFYKDKGSKFIALAWPVDNEEQIQEILTSVKKEYYDARHHCYAWILGHEGDHYRVNDDGEPSGTAGKPIYGQLLSAGLSNIFVVVVRYFGGIKLGVRGLIDAYKGATMDALQNATLVTKILYDHFQIDFDYFSMNDVMKVLKDNDLQQYDHQFDLNCSLKYKVRKSVSRQILETLEAIDQVMVSRISED
ncbi:MAG: YigZ family protein [Bacteroidales bacterium]|nr:YigZ family protein [Bacteroidales bacterium]NLM91331.1 YigZ family protein [Bacteroidales bacterium]